MRLERINLNVSKDTRKRLKARAKRLRMTESQAARDLLTQALDREEKEEFYRRVAESMTPQAEKRMLEIVAAFERLHG